MKIKEVAGKKEKELAKFIDDSKAKLLKLTFEVNTKETGKVRDIRVLKKDIAKALTVKRERELANEESNINKQEK